MSSLRDGSSQQSVLVDLGIHFAVDHPKRLVAGVGYGKDVRVIERLDVNGSYFHFKLIPPSVFER